MIYRGPGFLAIIWFGSSPTASRPLPIGCAVHFRFDRLPAKHFKYEENEIWQAKWKWKGCKMKDSWSKKSDTKRNKQKITIPVKVECHLQVFRLFWPAAAWWGWGVDADMKQNEKLIKQNIAKIFYFYFAFCWSEKVDEKRSENKKFILLGSKIGKYEAKPKF